ncbi:MAG: inositol-3-phosphate synthase [Egibacteraceae bacterium]
MSRQPGHRVGLWLVGVRGSVAVTAMLGAAAVAHGVADQTGLVTALPALASPRLPALADLVIGGHDLTDVPLTKRAEQLAAGGVVPAGLPAVLADNLDRIEGRLRDGVSSELLAQDPAGALHRVQEDLAAFRDAHGLTEVVVVNVASTEGPVPDHPAHHDLGWLRAALASGDPPLPCSIAYAYAALDLGCAYVDFTPSIATTLPALDALSRLRGAPYAGRDGKTGETLVKSALAPLFAHRGLRVRSWAGTNLLGGGDGATLAASDRAQSKLASKGRGLELILGYPVEAPVGIEYVADMGDWKTAWDHIVFEGFLGTRMRMQFIWEGCDSALAAPLVLDLARLAAAARAAGVSGPLPALAFFFKDPVGTDEHRLEAQFAALCAWVAELGSTA